MHIFFSGIGGTAIGPLALIAKQAGYEVSGSDKQDSDYLHYLQGKSIDIHIGQAHEDISAAHTKNPIDWFVYSSAVSIENPDHPELQFCKANNIKATKRDDLLNLIISEKNLKLIAVAGTHGKTTTTAMLIWLFKQLSMPVSYSVGAKLSFGDMGQYSPDSKYFILEADEFDRNFLSFHPHFSLITGIDYDHPDIYPTREDYEQAFRDFLAQSEQVLLWQSDFDRLQLNEKSNVAIIDDKDELLNKLSLVGMVNRRDAFEVIKTLNMLTNQSVEQLIIHMNDFPGLSRRFEQIAPHIYSDYAHTPEKIRGALQTAQEQAGGNVVVVYEGLHNTRQHFIMEDLVHLFDPVKKLYIVPSYLAREDESLDLLTPSDLVRVTSMPDKSVATDKNENLKQIIIGHQKAGDLVLCLTAGGGGSLDEWLRQEFAS